GHRGGVLAALAGVALAVPPLPGLAGHVRQHLEEDVAGDAAAEEVRGRLADAAQEEQGPGHGHHPRRDARVPGAACTLYLVRGRMLQVGSDCARQTASAAAGGLPLAAWRTSPRQGQPGTR